MNREIREVGEKNGKVLFKLPDLPDLPVKKLSISLISLISLCSYLPDLPDLPVTRLLASTQLPVGPPRQFGAGVTGAFEGWFAQPDGTQYFLVGYLNRNFEQELDVPIGPDNRLEPGGPDLGQPTHFLPDLPDLPVTRLLASTQLPVGPPRQFGAGVTGAFEGWFAQPDGTQYFLVGYLNRNFEQELDVPIGPDNRLEPGGPDLGQPTHFLPGRQTGMFLVTVPKDFTPQQRLTWTIVANGQTNVIPLRLHPDYTVSPFADVAIRNTPPILRFEEHGPGIQGPLALLGQAPARTTSVSAPLSLTVWVTDDAKFASGTMAVPRNPPPPVELTWSKYRGPGPVVFAPAKPALETLGGGGVNVPFSAKATVTARFTEPGEYALHVTANDYSGDGGGGEVCCWTTALVKVSVKGGTP